MLDISKAIISKTEKLKPQISGWLNATKSKRKMCVLDFCELLKHPKMYCNTHQKQSCPGPSRRRRIKTT